MDGYPSSTAAHGSSGDPQPAQTFAAEGQDPYHVNVKVDVRVELSQGEGRQEVQGPVRPQSTRHGAKEVKRVTGRKPSESQGSNTDPAPSQEVDELWRHQRFEKPEMRSTDCWDLTCIDQGWLLRLHRKPRKRLFHPVHGSLPVDPERLTP